MITNQRQKNIPSRWTTQFVGEVFEFLGTHAQSKDNMDYSVEIGDTRVRNIHYGDIHTRYSGYTDLNKDVVPVLKSRHENVLEDKYLQDGDVVMVDASEDYDGIGSSVEMKNIGDKRCVGGLHVFCLRNKNNVTVPGYRVFVFKHPIVHNWMQRISTYSKVYGISKSNLQKVKLIIPPIDEQERIVAVLEVWDDGMKKLKEKIAFKKEIKRGLAQQLLTGEKRLPGFNEEWRYIALSDILTERKEFGYQKDGLELYSLTITDGVCKKTERYNREFLVVGKDKKYKKTHNQDIVYNPPNLRYGAIAYNKNIKVVLLSPIYRILKINKGLNKDFFAYLLTSPRQVNILGSKYAEGTLIERMEVKIDDFLLHKVLTPSTEQEQKAISSVLVSADEEIATLEERLSLWKEQKRYLINNLITGKIRVH